MQPRRVQARTIAANSHPLGSCTETTVPLRAPSALSPLAIRSTSPASSLQDLRDVCPEAESNETIAAESGRAATVRSNALVKTSSRQRPLARIAAMRCGGISIASRLFEPGNVHLTSLRHALCQPCDCSMYAVHATYCGVDTPVNAPVHTRRQARICWRAEVGDPTPPARARALPASPDHQCVETVGVHQLVLRYANFDLRATPLEQAAIQQAKTRMRIYCDIASERTKSDVVSPIG